MFRWTDAAVRSALELGEGGGVGEVVYRSVSTDTRTIQPGDLFVALKGARFDGHDFVGEAVARGARGLVVERVAGEVPEEVVCYLVPDTLVALGRLARHRRRRLGARVCAVTGTNGKTTTKEMARAVLATRYRVHATTGNLNNLVGAPLTLLAAPAGVEAVVVEVGTNAPGEIARLRDIVEPDAAIVTGVAEGHLEGLGSVAGVLVEKTSLLERLPADGVAIVADEPAELVERARGLARRVQVAGWSERADGLLRAEAVSLDEEGRVRFRWAGREVRLRFRGRPNARNALLALGLGLEWGVDADAAVAALEALEPPRMRLEVVRYGDLVVICDCYNANPGSLAAAVDLLVSMPRRGGRVAVVGSMLELGAEGEALHRKAAAALAAAEIDLIVATGDFVRAFEPLAGELGERLIRAEDPIEAFGLLAPRLRGDEVVLLKGSRGVQLERLLPLFEEGRSGGAADRGGAAAPWTRGE